MLDRDSGAQHGAPARIGDVIVAVTLEIGGHATLLIEIGGARGSFRILCDPHLFGSFRGGLFAYHPARCIDIGAIGQLDAVWLSHSHRDHFDIPSLDALDRQVPVFCPADARIDYTLRRMGFKDVVTVDDWTEITLEPQVTLVWTPSTWCVPEHGLAIRAHGVCLWSLVDSVVRQPWVDRLLATLEVASLDLVLLPCQPVLETEILEGCPPSVQPEWDALTAAVLARAAPSCVVEFPQGQCCINEAAWLSHQKYPLGRDRLGRLLRGEGSRRVIWAEPGDRLTLAAGRAPLVEQAAAAWVRRQEGAPDLGFHPGGWISPLISCPEAQDNEGLDGLLQVDRGDRDLVSELVEEIGAAGRLRPCRYRFLVVDADGRVADERTVGLDAHGHLRLEPEAGPPDIEVCLSESDLADLLAGHLGYSAAQYGGRLREIRPGVAAAGLVAVVTSRHDRPAAGLPVVLGGISLVNPLLRDRPGGSTKELDAEIDACEAGLGLRPDRGYRPCALAAELVRRSARHPATAAVWEAVAVCLERGEDLAAAAGGRRHEGRRLWFGVLGRRAWPSVPEADLGAESWLLLANLLEAQPHLGSGVRFPDDCYRCLLQNILRSPYRCWRLETGLPEGSAWEIPRWRLASLFPISAERLGADLRRLGWQGELLAVPAASQPEWWLGVPQLAAHGCPLMPLTIEVAAGRPVTGVVSGMAGGSEETALPREPAFRLDLDHRRVRDARWLVEPLVRGDLRFSWLLPPRETAACAGTAADLTAFTERACLLALRAAKELIGDA